MRFVLAGLVLVALSNAGAIDAWGYIGIVPILTALVGFCPMYRLLGINSCAIRHRR